MNLKQIQEDIAEGEGLHREFKEAGSQLPRNLFETVCAFLNTDGGTILLGVADDGTVTGVDPDAAAQMKIDLANLSNNPQKLDLPYLLFPHQFELEGKTIIAVQVPLSSQMHKTGGNIFLRSEDGDYRVHGTHQLAGLINRKLSLFTEQRTLPFVTKEQLRPELFDRARRLMRSYNSKHPWADLDNEEMLRIGGFYAEDQETGKECLTLAAVLMFGTDLAIQQAAPAYKFDCLLRRDNVDRYDDRVMIYTNLMDAYDQMMEFVEKHLNDPFYQDEKANRVSLRDKIFREAISNIISHREYTGGAPARLMIYRDKVVLDNPCTLHHFGEITPKNLRPFSKNPTLCKFMIQLGRFDQLGSGVTNINKYLPFYANGATPIFNETRHGFELTIPLTDEVTSEVTGEAGTKSGLSRDQVGAKVEAQEAQVEVQGAQVGAQVKAQVEAQVGAQVKTQVVLDILEACMKAPLSSGRIAVALGHKTLSGNLRKALPVLREYELIEYTIPDKPSSRLQKYRLTDKGRQFQGAPPVESPVEPPVAPPVEPLVTPPVMPPVEPPVTPPVEKRIFKLLQLIQQAGALSNAEILRAFKLKDRRRMREIYIQPAMAEDWIEYTIPDKPSSRLQKYRLTDKGRQFQGAPPVESPVTPPVEPPVEPPVTPPVGKRVFKLLQLIHQAGALSNAEILRAFKLKDRRRMREIYIQPAMAEDWIEYTIQNKPRSRLQKYRLTEKGRQLLGGGE